jgi:hypothetical protein
VPNWTVLGCALLTAACSPRPPEFFLLKGLTRDHVSGGSYVKEETFVVANPPSDPSALRLAVEGFDRHTLSQADVLSRTRYTRWFFRESWGLPRTYQESSGALGGDTIEDHMDNLLLEVTWTHDLASARYTFYDKGVAK